MQDRKIVFKIHPLTGLHVYNDGTVLFKGTRSNHKKHNGYQYISTMGMNLLIHRIVAEVWCHNPKPNKFKIVNHKDGNKLNNHPDNLEWCDHAYNNAHAIDTGLRTDAMAVKIKNLWTGVVHHFPSLGRCATYFNLHKEVIARKVSGKGYPTIHVWLLAKEENDFPNITLKQAKLKNSGFKKALAYKRLEDTQWTISTKGYEGIEKETSCSENNIRAVVKGKKRSTKGYRFRELTNQEYADCTLERIDTDEVETRGGSKATPIIVTNTLTGEVKTYPDTQTFADEIGKVRKTIQRVRLVSPDRRTYMHFKIDFKT